MKHTAAVMLVLVGVLLGGLFACHGLQDRRPLILCFGDSLTSCGNEDGVTDGRYTDWLAGLMPYARIVNAGISGDTLDGGRLRFARDALSCKPDIMVIALGANDFWLRKRDLSEMRADLENMVSQARAKDIEVVVAGCFGGRDFWSEPCVEFGPDSFGVANGIAEFEMAVCKQYGCQYVPNMQVSIKPNMLAPYWDATVHPNKGGNREVALQLLPAVRRALNKWRTRTAR